MSEESYELWTKLGNLNNFPFLSFIRVDSFLGLVPSSLHCLVLPYSCPACKNAVPWDVKIIALPILILLWISSSNKSGSFFIDWAITSCKVRLSWASIYCTTSPESSALKLRGCPLILSKINPTFLLPPVKNLGCPSLPYPDFNSFLNSSENTPTESVAVIQSWSAPLVPVGPLYIFHPSPINSVFGFNLAASSYPFWTVSVSIIPIRSNLNPSTLYSFVQ